MARESLRNNPVLAALLGTVMAGLGHIYLRRWLRALGWLGVTVATSTLAVPDSAVSTIRSGTLPDPIAILPIVLTSAASVFDAYLIAKMRRQTESADTDGSVGPAKADASPACPTCGKPVDPDLEFCHWCTTEFDVEDVTERTQLDENYSND
ncbi:zinc ribbon domain-containing protein [Halorhabdus sp. CUG00001]|uniref:zinc ribbon domain-containing protein n=1 Tax=Halorhabdus sp. CUG00001 TaxID=2600297 RepID=UPI00131A7F31|nr:zinc ribbon domain-containing protein [Halorhabdus sp. CUG00001]